MNKNNLCKMFFGAMLISMIFGAFTRSMDKKLEAKAQSEAEVNTAFTDSIDRGFMDIVITDYELEELMENL